jgi:peroxiredoxin
MGPRAVALAARLAGRKVVIFGLPGAYTGTCTTAHVPSFIRTAAKFAEKGVDEIICVSVNDPFVMKAWGEATGATAAGITMLGDADAASPRRSAWISTCPRSGFHARSKRYSLLAEDGVVKVLNLGKPRRLRDLGGRDPAAADLRPKGGAGASPRTPGVFVKEQGPGQALRLARSSHRQLTGSPWSRSISASGASLSIALRQVDVQAAQAVAIMGGQGDVDNVVDVLPFGMVVRLLGQKRGAGHEAPGFGKVAELPDLADGVLAGHGGPAGFGQGRQTGLAVGFWQKFGHVLAFGIRALSLAFAASSAGRSFIRSQ